MPKILIYLPKIGESVSEATISKWYKKTGESISKDEIFVEIVTDKVTTELPSEYDAILSKVLVNENELVSISNPIAEFEISEEDYLEYKKYHTEKEVQIESLSTKQTKEKTFKENVNYSSYLSPVVRKIALEEGLSIEDLNKITPTGQNQRITKKDILSYLNHNKKTENSTFSDKLMLPITAQDTVIPITGIRKKAAEILTESYREIPHVTTVVELDVSRMVEIRNSNKKRYFEEYGLKLTYTHFCMSAVIKALEKYKELNAWFNVDEWIQKEEINLGFATSLANNLLIVPNIKNAQSLSFKELVTSINTMAQKAKQNELESEDFENTTFTISNTGIFGSLMGTPIITKPQVAVLALGEIKDSFRLDENDNVSKFKKMYASLSYDHRVINGALASTFLLKINSILNEDNFDLS